ncbi:MAG: GTP cyclohydrolase I FolE [Armatimonadota bacterium]|nr:GTP cyclohydrolase I FolE [Armatimonadota bacterium]MDR5697602.1 GTP cyclohydrolase I FolE [Armatimonadota bacterium]
MDVKAATRNDDLSPARLDRARIEAAVREILEAIGEDAQREGLAQTPRRIAEMYEELFAGLHHDPRELLEVGFDDEDHHEMVVVRDIPFYSMCEHHLMPFHGVAHVGYIPRGRILGVSKIARLVEILARRPQVQERLTSQIADFLCVEGLGALGAGVVIEAEHLCMTARGIRKPGSKVVTSATRGVFRDDARTRAEFFSLVGHS